MPSGVGGLDKGKGKEIAIEGGVSLPVTSGQGMAAGTDEDAKAEKKKKNSYKHLIKGIPGTSPRYCTFIGIHAFLQVNIQRRKMIIYLL